MIVGGGPQSDTLIKRFVDLAGGAGKARVVVFPMAGDNSAAGGERKARELREFGAEATVLDITREQANMDSVARILDSATGIWFNGGHQVQLAGALQGTKVEAAIHSRYQDGAVVGGTSAGAAVMSNPMMTGGERQPGGARPDRSTPFMTIAQDNVVTAAGFGLIRGAIIDQHFLRRKRHNRLISLVLERPEHLGVGIDESTALLVHPDGHWSVLGASAVLVYDARQSNVTASGAPVLGASEVRMHVLPAGSSYDPTTRIAKLPEKATVTAAN